MAWVCVNKNGDEKIFPITPHKGPTFPNIWYDLSVTSITLPKGSIKKLIDRELTWEDEPVELK